MSKGTREGDSNSPSYDGLSPSDKETIATGLRRGATRRDVATWLIAAGVTAASANSIISASRGAMAAQVKKGGKIRYAMDAHGPADTLDPQLVTSGIDYTRGRAHYNSLVQLDDSITPQPELAEEFSSNANATEWTFKLRKDVVFHDGSKLTADDVIWSMNRHIGDNSKSKAKTLVSSVAEWKKVDQHTVKAIMSSPNADLATVLGTFHFKILKQDTTDFQNPVGTGPYKLKEFKPGVRSVHERSDMYWREGANLEVLEITAITDPVARVNALLSGDIQMMTGVDPKAIKQIESSPGVGILSLPSGAYLGIVCSTDTVPGNNPDFVNAMKYIQRRERIVKSVLKGQGVIGNDQPINASYPDYCADVAQRPYDLDKAKFHLKKSGVTRAEIQLAEVGPGLTDIVLLMQREASKIGLTLDVKKVPSDGYWGAVWLKTPMHVTSWNMRPTANIMMTLAFAPDAPWNDSKWKNERMGKLLVESRGETDKAKRAEMFCEMQKLISEESGMIIPAHRNYVDGLADNVKGIGKLPLSSFGGGEWPEFVWVDA